MRHSAGIIPFRKNADGELEFFVGRPFVNSDYYAFLKGGIEEGETDVDAAIREFKEESGLTFDNCASQYLIDLGTIKQKKQKTIHAYAIHYPNINPADCFSNLTESGKPEIVAYRWMTFNQLERYTNPCHLDLYRKIIRMDAESKKTKRHIVSIIDKKQ